MDDDTPDRITPDNPLPMNDEEINQKQTPEDNAAEDTDTPDPPRDGDGNVVQPAGGDIAGPDLGDGSDVTADKGVQGAEELDSSVTGSGPSGGAPE